MKSVIIVTINGDMFLFEDNGLSSNDRDDLQKIADLQKEKNLTIKQDEKSICEQFVKNAESELNIILEPVGVSRVLRIKYY